MNHPGDLAFAAKLIEPHARGCSLTEAGQVLLTLTAPSVDNLEELRTRFDEALNKVDIHITIAGPPRSLVEDLAPCLTAFVAHWPRARITLSEMMMGDIAAVVAEGKADLGVSTNVELSPGFARLSIEPWYELDVVLITPQDHPLARRSRVRPEDLRAYPLVNAWNTLRDPAVHAAVVKLGLYQTQPRWVEARLTTVIRRCVEVGLGIGLVLRPPAQPPYPGLHERVMSRYFGRSTVYLVRPAGVYQHPAISDFVETVRSILAPHPDPRR